MKIPTIQEAEILLNEANKLNPGQWYDHCLVAGQAARNIAKRHPYLDADNAYILALLHDIGRRAGIRQNRHMIDGYRFMLENGYEDSARICLTHSFPYKDANSSFGKWDTTDEEFEFIKKYIEEVEYNHYDRLVQLCDYLSLPSGFCLLEKRMIDVALRYTPNHFAVLKWKTVFKIKEDFEAAMGCSIYSVLPGVVENTFNSGFSINLNK